eukprot:4557160-Ditylum_brightwellii.AAC.1
MEGEAQKKKNDGGVVGKMWSGRTDQNKRVVFPSLLLIDDDKFEPPASPLAREINNQLQPKTKVKLQPGDYE